VAVCPRCRADNTSGARFCSSCGNALASSAEYPSAVRKLVTVVFTDVTGFTALVERLDAERVRRVMFRYFEEMRAIVERHNGTVEKYLGDAVMAVFGIPQVHEDDALRGLRAAAEMRDTLELLNEELEREWGVRIQARTGVNTGEVATSSGEEMTVLGDVVNVAARLQQYAAPQEVLLGEATHRLAKDAIVVEEMEPLELKGKGKPVRAFRLLSVTTGHARSRRFPARMVGRDSECESLRVAFEKAVADRACVGRTVLGSAGIGKSTLADEFLRTVADRATILQGRCLSYGEGVTLWPVREVVWQAAGILDEDTPERVAVKLAALLDDEADTALIVNRLSQVLGTVAPTTTAVLGETFWAVRKVVELLARRRPVVIVFDDIHWAAPTLLDLIQHMLEWCRDAPVLIMCLSRPELLEQRPSWGTDLPNASVMRLAPLSPEESDEVIGNILGMSVERAHVPAHINDVADGNPLFIEEILSMLIEEGVLRRQGEAWVAGRGLAEFVVPPTLQALLAARLDRLAAPDRQVIEVASVMGQRFYRSGLLALVPKEYRSQVDTSLQTLTEKELIRPAVTN